MDWNQLLVDRAEWLVTPGETLMRVNVHELISVGSAIQMVLLSGLLLRVLVSD